MRPRCLLALTLSAVILPAACKFALTAYPLLRGNPIQSRRYEYSSHRDPSMHALHEGLRHTFRKSTFRPVRILSAFSDEVETYIHSLQSCVWLVGVEKYSATISDLVARVVNPSRFLALKKGHCIAK